MSWVSGGSDGAAEREQRQRELEETRKREEDRLKKELEEETKKIDEKFASKSAATAAAKVPNCPIARTVY